MNNDDIAQLIEITQLGIIAFRNTEPTLLAAFLAPDFVVRSPGEPDVTREAFLEWIRSHPGTVLSNEGEGLEARVFGDVGVVTGVQRSHMRIESSELFIATGFTEVFERREGRWQAVFCYSVPLGAPPANAQAD